MNKKAVEREVIIALIIALIVIIFFILFLTTNFWSTVKAFFELLKNPP